MGQASYRCIHPAGVPHTASHHVGPVRTVAPQITALCQAAAVVIGAAAAHLTPEPKPEPEPESEHTNPNLNPNQAVLSRTWLN